MMLRCGMMDKYPLAAHGAFDSRVPRYAIYPPSAMFGSANSERSVRSCLGRLEPGEPVSVYVHIPFCAHLCWFCAYRTQRLRSTDLLEAYVDTLLLEIARVADALPEGTRMGHLHWGGGTPTILPPDAIRRLAAAMRAGIAPTGDFSFSVEIDPTLVDAARIAALAEAGMTDASLGIQDFSEDVQIAIGRRQSFGQTRDCVDMLREAGIASLDVDIAYGLPRQTVDGGRQSLETALTLRPDRLTLSGYVHAPLVAKRQRMIEEAALPDQRMRHDLFAILSETIAGHGYETIGIDHFVRPGHELSRVARQGRLRRNVQGYTDDACPSVIGFGASAISSFDQGHAKNAAATGAYIAAIHRGHFATARSHAFSLDDRIRARAIEMLLCDCAIDLRALESLFGTAVDLLRRTCLQASSTYGPDVTFDGDLLRVLPPGRALTRKVANLFDAYRDPRARYSTVS
jgi:oxygen-independent coproporphyrinogen-3 oxidase